ncbi:MAG: hypothetical protein ACFCU5_20915 [Pleurocapsa sp.]
MGRRFKRLNYALKALSAPNSDVKGNAPAGSILDRYQKFKNGETILSYPRSPDSKPKSLEFVSVKPFFFGGAADSEAIIKYSKRTADAAAAAAVKALCNHVPVDNESHKVIARFRPAKVTLFKETSEGATAPETSKITGVRYDKKRGNSYTLPFGASTADKSENEVRKKLLVPVLADATLNASFTPERA